MNYHELKRAFANRETLPLVVILKCKFCGNPHTIERTTDNCCAILKMWLTQSDEPL
jgi:hypothetical protein